MITMINIIAATNELLRARFPTIPLISKDLEEGFERPAFFTEWDAVESGYLTDGMKQDSFTMRIYYFPTDEQKNNLALLQMLEDIKTLLGYSITVSDTFSIPVNEVNFTVTNNKILVVDITLEYYQLIEPAGDDLENLEFNL